MTCESFKQKRSKEYFERKKGGSAAGSTNDLASMASASSANDLSSLGGSAAGSTADLVGLDGEDKGKRSSLGKKVPPKSKREKK